MRIISGRLKGKAFNFLKNLTTRPLKDSVKENIFNILEHSNLINIKIEKANILDLYSGIGSFGLECISRGAKKVTFVEKDKNALIILKNNLIKLSITDKAKIVEEKIENAINKKIEKYNIFFLDPPFKDKEFINNLFLIKKNKLYQNKHVIIIHRDKSSSDPIDDYLDVIIEKKYGRSKIIFGILAK